MTSPAPIRHLIETLQLRESAAPVRANPGWAPPDKIALSLPAIESGHHGSYLDAARAVAGDAEVVALDLSFDPDPERPEVAGADVFFGFGSPRLVRGLQQLRWLQHYGTGLERLLTPEVLQRDFILTNMQRISGPPIAEHAIGLLLMLTRRLGLFYRRQLAGDLSREWPLRVPMEEIGGRTMLVAGLGGLGTEIARRAAGLGMRVLGVRRSDRSGLPWVEHVGLMDELHALAREADVVVNCLPLTMQTRGVFDAGFFHQIKPGALFIAVSRGENTITGDLVAALRDGRVGGAGLDVTDPEPLPAGHPLLELPNVVITPHVSYATDRSFERTWQVALENLRRYAGGEKLLNLVDKRQGY